MKIASEVKTRQELNDLKSIMKVYVVSRRIHELAELSVIYNLTDMFKKDN